MYRAGSIAKPPKTSFAVVCAPGLRSHRSPAPLFQADFDKLSGSLFHLGNPGCDKPDSGAFFASELLSEPSRDAVHVSFLEFAPEHVGSVRLLLDWLLLSSPQKRLLFTSDWQFGPREARRFPALDLNKFWKLHESRSLLLNAAYSIAAFE